MLVKKAGERWKFGLHTVAYDAESMLPQAKEAQTHLLAIQLTTDGFSAITDGEYSEKRLASGSGVTDAIAREERRILGKLLKGVDAFGTDLASAVSGV